MNSRPDDIAADNAWHRQPTVWIVLGVLAFTIISSFILLFLAANNPPDLIERNPAPIAAPAGAQE